MKTAVFQMFHLWPSLAISCHLWPLFPPRHEPGKDAGAKQDGDRYGQMATKWKQDGDKFSKMLLNTPDFLKSTSVGPSDPFCMFLNLSWDILSRTVPWCTSTASASLPATVCIGEPPLTGASMREFHPRNKSCHEIIEYE